MVVRIRTVEGGEVRRDDDGTVRRKIVRGAIGGNGSVGIELASSRDRLPAVGTFSGPMSRLAAYVAVAGFCCISGYIRSISLAAFTLQRDIRR